MSLAEGRVGLGLIGAGAIARIHAEAMQALPNVELRGIHSRSPERCAALAAEFQTTAYASLDEFLLRPEIIIVCVTVPSGLHGEIVERCLVAGKHVLCEKPLELSTARIDRMLATATQTQRQLGAVFQLRLGRDAQLLKAAVVRGRFGRIALCSAYVKWWRPASYFEQSSWRGTAELDGGVMLNQAIHGIDLLQWIVGMPTRLTAQCRTRTQRIAVEDTVGALLEFADGSLGVIEASTGCFPGASLRLEIAGDRGYAVLENDRLTRWEFAEPDAADAAIREGAGPAIGGASDPKAIGSSGHQRQIEDFVSAVIDQRPPLVPAIDARNSVALIEAIYRSAASGGPVNL